MNKKNNLVKNIFFTAFMPFVLLFFCPVYVMLLVYTGTQLQGSFTALFSLIGEVGFVEILRISWLPNLFGTSVAWRMIAIFAGLQLLFMRLLPGKQSFGPVTPQGNIPEYRDNGVLAYMLTVGLFLIATFGFNLFPASIIFDRYLELIGALNLSALVFCVFLFIKGLYAPSSNDSGRRGNIFYDYYWGIELYPRVLGWDVKVFTNCRFGMMSWSLIVISCAAKQYELFGYLSTGMLVTTLLQLAYVCKFFIWEIGYLSTIDIMHDRAGFYLCWGCLVWLPCLYMTPSIFMATNPVQLPIVLTVILLFLGLLAVIINYSSDLQRMRFRKRKGNMLIFGRQPRFIQAEYTTEDGTKHQSLLLVSGWWGISRHFNYFAELFVAFLWTVPALFNSFYPYQYFIFLLTLLLHRCFRDEIRCAKKYGKYWQEYCKLVPNRILPSLGRR